MRALQLARWKQPPEFVDLADPEPGPGEVIVRIGGAGLCHSDLHLLHDFDTGMLPFEPPFVLGHENAGWVQATAPASTGSSSVSRWRSTDRGVVGCVSGADREWRTTANGRRPSGSTAAGSGSTAAWPN